MDGDLKEHVDWYEATLSLKERRSRGHFSTPPHLGEQILDACEYTSDKKLANIRVLDPACGSGNFLAEATRRLISSLRSGRTVGPDLSRPERSTVEPDLSRPERSDEIATLI